MRYGSVCSGIEAASVAWAPLGWQCQFVSEIEAFPRAVLGHHYPTVPLHGDFTTIQAGDYGAINLLVGGTPCQSFSVAGLRGGLADERGNLALEYLRLADRLRPLWLVWENVPGVLSSGGGRDFGSFLGGLVQLGYGFAYRVLDAQFFGLAQRRKRVFVVGCLGDWRRAAAVLFEPASLRWNPAPSRAAGEKPARCLANGTGSVGGQRYDGESEDFVVASAVAPPVTSNPYGDHESREGLLVAHSLRAEGFDASEDGTGRGTPLVPIAFDCQVNGLAGFAVGSIAGTLRSGVNSGGHSAVAYGISSDAVDRTGEGDGSAGERAGLGISINASPSLRARPNNSVAFKGAVRRLTPRECERLQGFPDDYTAIPYRGKPATDGPRYRALGNSMAVPVMAWIGQRIAQQHAATMRAAA